MTNQSCYDPLARIDSIDQLSLVLSTECNRQVLRYFLESSEQAVQLEELADYIVTQQDKTALSDPNHVATRLHHASLPNLAEAGIVDYDWRQHTVRYQGDSLGEEHWNLIADIDEETQ